MCGIIGYVGEKNAMEVIISSLERLSYRGYDSAGISLISKDEERIFTRKCKGKIDALKSKLKGSFLPFSSVGIGHTRWATHGGVTDFNSHPHGTESVSVVHNGIIENYLELRRELSTLGYSFSSETDSESCALLIDYLYKKCKNPLEALRDAGERLRGSFAIAVIFSDIPDTVFAMRHESPLLIGLGENEAFVGSDIPAFLRYTERYFRLNDGEICALNKRSVRVYDKRLEEVKREAEVAEIEKTDMSKNGYEHFMRKEIAQEPSVLKRIFSLYARGDRLSALDRDRLKATEKISIIGCGTAYHAGLYLNSLLKELTNLSVSCEVASEFRYSHPRLGKTDTLIFISQSGETADTLSSLRMAKAAGAYTVGIVNVAGSSIATEADAVIYTHAGAEIAVASTKAYTAQCTVGVHLALYIAELLGTSDRRTSEIKSALCELPELIFRVIDEEEKIAVAARGLKDAPYAFFIGRQRDYLAALEGALKLKEISYIHTECYPAGELKHGTISLINDGIPVVVLFSDGTVRDKTLSNLKEVMARGARTIAFTPPSEEVLEVASVTLTIPPTDNLLAPIVLATALQLFAYHAAKERGTDIDQPRNLAKSVTVE